MRESVAGNDPGLTGGSPVSRARYLLLTLVVIVGVGVTLYAALSSMTNAQRRAQDAFDREAGIHILSAENRIHDVLGAVAEVGDLFDSSTFVSGEEFLTFVSRNLARHPDLTRLAWAPLVTATNRNAFEAQARADGAMGYEIVEYDPRGALPAAGPKDTYFPVLYSVAGTDASDDAAGANGMDISTWPWTVGIIEQARDAGTVKVTPAFASPSGTRIAILHPIYGRGVPTDTVADRQASLIGFIVGIVQSADLLSYESSELLTQRAEHGVATMVTESSATGDGLRLLKEPGLDVSTAEFIVSVDVQAANQTWVFTVASTTSFYATRDTIQPWLLLILGLSITGLISGYVIILQRRSTTAEAMVTTRARQLAVANAALSREINERTAAEARAVAERGQLQSILNTTVDAIITIDGEGLIQSFNSAAQATFGYAPDEVINKNVSVLMPEPDHGGHDQYVRNYHTTGEAKIIGIGREVTGLRKDGRKFPLELSVSEAPVSKGKLYTGIVRDISVRKAAEAALAGSEARFRLLFESSPAGITFSTGSDGIEQVNPTMLRMLGRSEDEVVGKILADFSDDSYERPRTDSRARIMSGETETTVAERLLRRANGDPLWVQITAAAFRDEHGTAVGIISTVEDITVRKAAEERLAESEARLRAMLESAPIGMTWSTPGEPMQTANPKLREILGRTDEEIAGHRLSDFAAPGTQPRDGTTQILAEGPSEAVTEERHLLRGDGTAIWVAVTASAVRQPGGTLNGVLRMVEDITERREAEEELRASEERFRVLIESAPVGILVSTESGNTSLANPALGRMLGIEPSQILGKRLTDYWYPGYEQEEGGSRATLLSGEADRLQYQRLLERADGAPLWVNVAASAIGSPNGPRLVMRVLEDITERKQAEEALRESEERFRVLFDSSSVGMTVSPVEGGTTQANPALARMLGVETSSIIGKILSDYWYPGYEQRDTSSSLPLIAGEAEQVRYERLLQRADGAPVWVNVTATIVDDPNGTRLILRAIEDITERRHAEDALRDSEERFRDLFEVAPVGIGLKDAQNRLIAVNEELASIFGRNTEELIGNQLKDYLSPTAVLENKTGFAGLVSGELENREFEHQWVRPDGEEFWGSGNERPIRDGDGAFRYSIIAIEGITERKKVEQELRRNEEQLRVLFDLAPIGLAFKDKNNKIITSNPATQQIFGRSEEELAGASFKDYLAPEYERRNADSTAKVVSGDLDINAFERPYLKADGSTVWAKGVESAVRDSDGNYLFSIQAIEDITARRLAEQEIRESEERFRVLFELAPIALALKNEENLIIGINPAGLAIFGRSEEEMLGVSLKGFRPPWFVPANLGTHERLVTGEDAALTFERPYLRGDGTTLWARGVERAVHDARGKFTYSIQAIEDVTERRVAEQEIRDSEQRFRFLFDSAPIGIAMVAADRTVMTANQALAKMLNTTVEELRGGWFGKSFPPTSPGLPEPFWSEVVSGEVDYWQSERQVIAAGASAGWVQITSSAVRDSGGRFLYAIRMIEDITAIKQAEVEIRASEYRFRSLFDASPVGIALIDDTSRITSINAALQQMLGGESEDIVGRELGDFRSPDDPRGGGVRSTTLAEDPDTSAYVVERLFRRKNGSEMWAQVVTAPVRDDEGKFLFGVRMVVDISERKQVERLKDEFLSMVSHELRTPLTAIQAGVGLASSGALGEMPDKALRMLNIANDNTHRLTRLVNDVLDVERMTAGRIVLERANSRLSSMVEQAVQAVSAIAAESEVRVESAPASGSIVADSDRIIQTLTNLIANAVKFSPPGATVSVRVTDSPTSVRFDVHDQGRGIPKEQVARIFDRFYQVDASDSRVYNGTGLGLAISKWIVTEHGGSIWVESELGMGSTFSFELPKDE